MVDRKPIVCIGVPCYGSVAPEILEDWFRFAYHCGRRLPQYDFQLAIKTKTEQFRARNAIVNAAQQFDADYLLFLDDDMVVNPFNTIGPTGDYSLIERLIAHDKDICGVLYYHRGGECAPVLMRQEGAGYRFLRDDEIEGGLQPVDVAGGGCLLIKSRVFDRIKFPYFEPEFEFGTDIQLCRKAQAAGFEVWADTSVELGHLKQERSVVTSRNRHRHQVTDTVSGEVKKEFVLSDFYARLIEDAKEYTGFADIDEMAHHSFEFLKGRDDSALSDPEWYKLHPKERVARQVWFNTSNPDKKAMTEYIMSSVSPNPPLSILDFGCGIGITAFYFAEKGHRVTALDLEGTGTLDFLKWRAKKHNLPITFHESRGGPPALGSAQYDVIVAMDSIEHIAEWRRVVEVLSSHIRDKGVFFSNNGILEDLAHPEHYAIDNREFISICAQNNLLPLNQISYVKRASVAAQRSESAVRVA